jgi:adenine/guanine phosphoribosyltransferase-like PRPP-binding protein
MTYIENGTANRVETMLRPGTRLDYDRLIERFQRDAVVQDAATGFIRVAFMNKAPDIDPKMLGVQADILAWIFRYSLPTRIIGIPESGLPLAREVARRFPGAKFIQSAKENGRPIFFFPRISFPVYSFTQKSTLTMITEPIEPRERYLIVDDVVAFGNAGNDFTKVIQSSGAEVVGLAVGFDKQFQGGATKIAHERHIPVASVVTIAGISEDNRVVLSHV